MNIDPAFGDEKFCYLTTTGRTSGEPREIEIWFALSEGTAYLMSGGRDRSHWVRNIRQQPRVSLRIRETTFAAAAREVASDSDEDGKVRALLLSKYQPTVERDLGEWSRTALPMAIEIDGVAGS
ncbi:MAG TPA: nitroreductase family deazaflavin-dependent oxidoreductase [Dehalococcoidia bacterium]|nr:nitroreductase family deazaflavin-dependent oxidoreductase [Dehalococcoidia bacterium]